MFLFFTFLLFTFIYIFLIILYHICNFVALYAAAGGDASWLPSLFE
jgi:hypothetical protein